VERTGEKKGERAGRYTTGVGNRPQGWGDHRKKKERKRRPSESKWTEAKPGGCGSVGPTIKKGVNENASINWGGENLGRNRRVGQKSLGEISG